MATIANPPVRPTHARVRSRVPARMHACRERERDVRECIGKTREWEGNENVQILHCRTVHECIEWGNGMTRKWERYENTQISPCIRRCRNRICHEK